MRRVAGAFVAGVHAAAAYGTPPRPFRRGSRGRVFRAAWNGLALMAVFLLPSPTVAAELALTQSSAEIVVRSSAPPTWRIVIATNPQASSTAPGGGTVRALHVPADAPESLVSTEPADFCCGGWGLDNLEWRYVEAGRGVRAPLGTTATIESLEIVERSAARIVVAITGRWKRGS